MLFSQMREYKGVEVGGIYIHKTIYIYQII